MSLTRLIALEDADALADLLRVNREHLAPWEPFRDDGYYTADGQREAIRVALENVERGTGLAHVILDADGAVVGRITLNEIVRGPFQSSGLGYWLSESATGRGLATAAAADFIQLAFGELGLHRLQAGTLPTNLRSQRVLERNGFERFGIAPRYLKIAGDWQDHVLFQLLNE